VNDAVQAKAVYQSQIRNNIFMGLAGRNSRLKMKKVDYMALKGNKFELLRTFASIIIFFLSWTRCEIAFRTGQYGVTREMGFLEARKILGGLDAGSYIQGGLSLADGTFRDGANNFIWELWPPGMSIFNFLFVKVFGIDSSPLLIWSLASSLVTALLTYILLGFLRNQNRRVQFFGLALIAIILLSSATQGWLLDQGIMYAEGLTLLGLFISLFFLGKYLEDRKRYYLLLAGFGLSISVFMRSVNLVIIYLLVLFLAISLIAISLRVLLKFKGDLFRGIHLGSLSTLTVAPIFLMAIWMAFRATWIPDSRYQWVTSATNSWKWYWMRDSDFKGTGWEIVAGIDNWACQINKAVCTQIHANPETNWDYQGLSLRSIFQNPITFLTERIPDFWDYWILNGRWLYPPQSRIPASISLLEGVMFLFILLFALFLITKIWSKKIELAFLQLAILLGNFLPLIIYHLEGRYFLPIKLIAGFIILQNLQVCRTHQIKIFTRVGKIHRGRVVNHEVSG
jgi:hypothetical protein